MDSLVGFDISSEQFPSYASGVAEGRMRLFEHNVVHPLPEEHFERYDVVHQRLLILGLKRGEWPVAISNLVTTLSECVASLSASC